MAVGDPAADAAAGASTPNQEAGTVHPLPPPRGHRRGLLLPRLVLASIFQRLFVEPVLFFIAVINRKLTWNGMRIGVIDDSRKYATPV